MKTKYLVIGLLLLLAALALAACAGAAGPPGPAGPQGEPQALGKGRHIRRGRLRTAGGREGQVEPARRADRGHLGPGPPIRGGEAVLR